MPDDTGGTLARDAFLTTGQLQDSVRDVVASSWERSSRAGVRPDGVRPGYAAELGESDLVLLVRDVMNRAAQSLGSEPVSMIFADPTGRVLHRISTDATLTRALEQVSLAPGFGYGEDSVGTNGIGTALALRAPTLIVGAEHFSEPLVPFACAGAPVHHPLGGTLLGVLDLTCLAGVSNALLLTYAKTIAAQIEDELLAKVSVRELCLLRDYLAACRHASGPVLAVGDEIFLMNRLASQRLDPVDRAALLARTGDAISTPDPQILVADLPSGAVARLDYRPTSVGTVVVGGVVRVQLSEPGRSVTSARRALPPSAPQAVPGLAGTSPEWLRATSQLRAAHRSGSWPVIDGERGVGKYALARAVHLAESPGRHFCVLDASASAADPEGWLDTLAAELDADSGTVVLRRVEQLHPDLVTAASELLVERSDRSPGPDRVWVVATRDSRTDNDAVGAQVLPCFDRTILVEPLRHRSDDVRALVPSLVRALAPGREVRLSPAALNQLVRHPWPGNVTQLRDVLRRALTTKRTGVLEIADLPPECMAVGRRILTPLESLERDAITRALADHQGNKGRAAEHLGMSRATIYRKIRAYEIDPRG